MYTNLPNTMARLRIHEFFKSISFSYYMRAIFNGPAIISFRTVNTYNAYFFGDILFFDISNICLKLILNNQLGGIGWLARVPRSLYFLHIFSSLTWKSKSYEIIQDNRVGSLLPMFNRLFSAFLVTSVGIGRICNAYNFSSNTPHKYLEFSTVP